MLSISKLYILIFTLFYLEPCSANGSVNLTCDYSTIDATNYEYFTTNLYGCVLQDDFPYIDEITVSTVTGNHSESNTNVNVAALLITNKKIFRIPNLSSIFTALTFLRISETPLSYLSKEQLNAYNLTLEHLAITNSEIEIVEDDLFSDFLSLFTIDLRNNKIFYITSNAFTGDSLLNLLLEGNGCNTDSTEEDVGNYLNNSTTDGLANFIAAIHASTCGSYAVSNFIEKYQQSRIDTAFNAYTANESYHVLLETLNIQGEDIETCQTNLNQANDNLTQHIELYSNTTIEIEELRENLMAINSTCETLKSQTSALESTNQQLTANNNLLTSKVEELESKAEKCLDVNGTCRFTDDRTYGYTCIAHNINVVKQGEEIEWTGTYSAGMTSRNILGLIFRDLVVEYIPSKIGVAFIRLETLIIRNCGLKKLSKKDFEYLDLLENIIITGNEITAIEAGVFDNLLSLNNIDLSENKIKSLPSKIFAQLDDLESINLNKNQLTNVRSDFLPAVNEIENFSATDNQLVSVESSFVWKLRNANLIDFTGNGCNQKFDKNYRTTFVTFYNTILKKC